MINLAYDREHIWHPYSCIPPPNAPLPVAATEGRHIILEDGRRLVDGMSSWWAAIHGYNHPELVLAVARQLKTMPHIMFGGLTHEPAVDLAEKLVTLSPVPLKKVFFADSGSVAVEVALKIALQYWMARRKPQKHIFLTVRNGYHGDTFGAMSVTDPDNGMHSLFAGVLPKHYFAPAPHMGFDLKLDEPADDIAALAAFLDHHHDEIAAIILEPIVQGAGGMRFYRPAYVRQLRAIADDYNVLLIFDEIATGFGRTGKLFACEWAGISPDIMTVGKALTGGMMTLAATLTTEEVAYTLCNNPPRALMHGPTFMANPTACAAANASIELLLKSAWQDRIQHIEAHLQEQLMPLSDHPGVADVRVLGAIGVIELERDDLAPRLQDMAVREGAWLRPFGRLFYTMPAFNIEDDELATLTGAMITAVKQVVRP
ncbi:adenosylmethionine-8-amino-7-oxononanoate aminotransferase [Sulfurivirga caldicuralii]|uniref:Adenosylmethionine-8-amino-7-oxononanoate aminotransferase n=1 Tax=Sulfurivirga caldicuralii TaxID=364032 RepID=A0A1N6DKG2_9GAMM|nr:adenosylmethionine--8-amino-7-oxononanoate transaminase [Sulfurivirga caldicuralii]SIN71321.1 adenosylmethionine-8-amino-7-oxononanoate aminotransferase [Sulfurivirga caldicuralii]